MKKNRQEPEEAGVRGYVFDVTHVFESAFYFEGGDAGVYHVEQAVGG